MGNDNCRPALGAGHTVKYDGFVHMYVLRKGANMRRTSTADTLWELEICEMQWLCAYVCAEGAGANLWGTSTADVL